jgi:transcriptional regulator with XRE-family HTH domain
MIQNTPYVKMDATKAFNLTIELFKLKPSEISQKTGIAKSTISDFSHGNRELRTGTMQRLVSGFPYPAKMYFYALLSAEPGQEETEASKEAIAA